jgi:hypothetical protein
MRKARGMFSLICAERRLPRRRWKHESLKERRWRLGNSPVAPARRARSAKKDWGSGKTGTLGPDRRSRSFTNPAILRKCSNCEESIRAGMLAYKSAARLVQGATVLTLFNTICPTSSRSISPVASNGFSPSSSPSSWSSSSSSCSKPEQRGGS